MLNTHTEYTLSLIYNTNIFSIYFYIHIAQPYYLFTLQKWGSQFMALFKKPCDLFFPQIPTLHKEYRPIMETSYKNSNQLSQVIAKVKWQLASHEMNLFWW